MTPEQQEVVKLENTKKIIDNMKTGLLESKKYEELEALNTVTWLIINQIVLLEE